MAEQTEEQEMGFFDHLEVLRWHLVRSAAAIVIMAIVFFVKTDFVFDTVLFGPTKTDFPTYRALCYLSKRFNWGESLCISGFNVQFMNTELFGQFIIQLKTAVVMGFIVAFPYIIFELWRFVKPALTEGESRQVSKVILGSSIFFFIGVLFSYFIIVPFSINFAFSYEVSAQIDNRITLDNYIDFLTTMSLGIGLVFELPMIAMALARFGLLTAATMRKFRRHSIVVILIAAAIITPSPDIFTQMIVAIPIYFLFEFSIFAAGRIEKRADKAAV